MITSKEKIKNIKIRCEDCKSSSCCCCCSKSQTNMEDLIVCLICLQTHCTEHSVNHCNETFHSLGLRIIDCRVWCFPCKKFVVIPKHLIFDFDLKSKLTKTKLRKGILLIIKELQSRVLRQNYTKEILSIPREANSKSGEFTETIDNERSVESINIPNTDERECNDIELIESRTVYADVNDETSYV